MNRNLAALLGRMYRDKEGDDGAAAGDDGAAAAKAGDDDNKGAAAAAAADDGKGAAKDKDKDEGGKGGKGDDGAGPWGPDWRQRLAGGDEAKLKRAGRYADPAAIFDSLTQLQDKISRGELRTTLPKDATPAQVKAWRDEQGIPEAPDKYDLGGMKIADEDKPVIDSFLKAAHGANMPADTAKATIDWYYAEVERQTEQRAAADKAASKEAEDQLREEWGPQEFRANINSVKGLLSTAPESVRDRLMHGRLADGKPILGDADTVRFLLGIALELNPATSLDLPSGANTITAIDDEIKSIEAKMRKDRAAYNRDEKMQARYRDLLTAKEKVRSKS